MTDHAHVEASMFTLLLVGLCGIIDIWVDIADGNPNKGIGYLIAIVVLYAILRLVFKRMWKGS